MKVLFYSLPPSKPSVLITNILQSVPSFFSIIVSLFMHTHVVKYTQPKSYEKRTSFILAGENMGPEKLKKAEALGVRLLNENEFLEMIGENV